MPADFDKKEFVEPFGLANSFLSVARFTRSYKLRL